MKCKYKILKISEPTASEGQLDEIGLDGWALVQIYQYADAWYYVFVRQLAVDREFGRETAT